MLGSQDSSSRSHRTTTSRRTSSRDVDGMDRRRASDVMGETRHAGLRKCSMFFAFRACKGLPSCRYAQTTTFRSTSLRAIDCIDRLPASDVTRQAGHADLRKCSMLLAYRARIDLPSRRHAQITTSRSTSCAKTLFIVGMNRELARNADLRQL